MEPSTQSKPTKPVKKSNLADFEDNKIMSKILELIDAGIPLKRVVFHDTVLSLGGKQGGEPENALYSSGSKPSRTAEMWYTPHGVVVKQRENYKIIPLAAIKDNDVLIK